MFERRGWHRRHANGWSETIVQTAEREFEARVKEPNAQWTDHVAITTSLEEASVMLRQALLSRTAHTCTAQCGALAPITIEAWRAT